MEMLQPKKTSQLEKKKQPNSPQTSDAKLDTKTFLRLMNHAKPHAWRLALALILLTCGTASDVIGPILIKIFIDGNLTPHSFPQQRILLLGGSYLLLTISSSIFNYLQLVSFQTIALEIIQQIRIDVFAKVQHLGLSFFDKTPGGTLISRITNDTEAMKDLFVSVLSTFIQNIIQLVGIYVSMFILDVRLASFCLVLAPILVLIMRIYQKYSSRIFHLARHRLGLVNAKLNESLQGMYVIQAMRQEKRLAAEFDQINESYRLARFGNIKLNAVMLRPLVDIVYFLSLMLVISFFGYNSFKSAVDIGVVYAFVNYLDRFFEPVNNMMQRLNLFQQAIVSAERVFQVLDESDLAPGQVGNEQPKIRAGEIAFDHVSFSYDGKTEVLKDISFTARPSETVALVGHTGSGKSTVVSLLLRFYQVTKGRIWIDGHPLEDFTEEELRGQVGLVLQDPFLFVGDIQNNIRLSRKQISDAEIREAAMFVQADPFIQNLPGQYLEKVGERGATLSSGQRQLLSFARTIAAKPKILVLDEATASIDTQTEEAIQDALGKMRKNRTTIAIAHRLSTIQDADLILVLHHGQIVERGTHQSLIEKQGLYHKMFLLQQGMQQGLQPGLHQPISSVSSPFMDA
jgi:ATP-binding cassette, subfamily B, multidrug efflux pump